MKFIQEICKNENAHAFASKVGKKTVNTHIDRANGQYWF